MIRVWRVRCMPSSPRRSARRLCAERRLDMRRISAIGLLLPATLLTTAGCATKEWVKDLLGKKEVEIDQRFTGVEKRAADDAQRVEGMGFRLKTVETGLDETGGLARAPPPPPPPPPLEQPAQARPGRDPRGALRFRQMEPERRRADGARVARERAAREPAAH